MSDKTTAYLLPPLVPLIDEIESGSSRIPTPTRVDATLGSISTNHNWDQASTTAIGLGRFVMMYPTSVAYDAAQGRILKDPEMFEESQSGVLYTRSKPPPSLDHLLLQRREMLPTPLRSDSWFGDVDPETAASSVESGKRASDQLATRMIAEGDGGQLNPEWVEALMGYPLGWTDASEGGSVSRRVDEGPRSCETCGITMYRKRFGKRLEDLPVFNRRRFCSLSCANTRTVLTKHGYSWRARKHLKDSCEACGSEQKLEAHHVDQDTSNNDPTNIQTLCSPCHDFWHAKARNLGVSIAGRMPSLGLATGEVRERWTESEPSATPSSRRSRRSSAARSSAPSVPPQEPVLLRPKQRPAADVAEPPARDKPDPEASGGSVAASTSINAPMPSPPLPRGTVDIAPVTLGVRPSRVALPRVSPVTFAASVARPPPLPLVDPFLAHHAERLRSAGTDRLILGDGAAWRASSVQGEEAALDAESFSNFFCVCLKRMRDGALLSFELSDRSELDRDGLRSALAGSRVVTFNGLGYDLLMVALALSGADPARLKAASDRIVKEGLRPQDLESELGVRLPRWDHVDLATSNPSVRQGLKVLGGRLHGRFMVDLPFAEDAYLTPEQMNVVTLYCANDLDHTELVWRAMREPLALREALGLGADADFTNRSDAQIGEAIVLRRYERATGRRLGRIDNLSRLPGPFRYELPDFIEFGTQPMRDVVDRLSSAEFRVDAGGDVVPPEFLKKLKVTIGGADYTMGIGGLHSNEEHRSLRSDDGHVLIDVDVASQYPKIIAKLGLYPPSLGSEFIDVYARLIDERIAAKAAGERTKADGLKIATNGVFGKLGSPYSALYSPRMLIATTLTGQLSILSLIERALGWAEVGAVSANTDGVTFWCPRDREDSLQRLIAAWEAETGFTVEQARYRSLHSASVNSYVAIKEDGTAKRKGPLADPWSEEDLRGQMSKNPQMTILSEACLRHLRDGVPVEDTVRSCHDPRMFVTLIRANTGAAWCGTPIGRVVRFYWSTDGDPVCYVRDGRRVAKTEGARPLLEMSSDVPIDLDFDRYIRESNKWLVDLGATNDSGATPFML